MPQLNSPEIQAHLRANPVSASERAQLFLEQHKDANGRLDPSAIDQLKNLSSEEADVVKEVIHLALLRDQCSDLVLQCREEQGRTRQDLQRNRHEQILQALKIKELFKTE